VSDLKQFIYFKGLSVGQSERYGTIEFLFAIAKLINPAM